MKCKFVVCAMLLAALSPLSAQMASSHASTVAKPQQSSSFKVTGKAVARVNGVVLSDSDLLREMLVIFPYAKQHGGFPKDNEPEIRKGAMEMIVFEELVYQEAERQKMTVPEARMKRALAEFRKQFPSQAAYQQYRKAEAQGSEQVLIGKIRRVLLIEAYLKTEVKNKSAVSLVQARAFYDKNQAKFAYKESFAIQSISFMPPANANPVMLKEARKKAEDAHRQAKATKSYQEFGLLAEKISEDDFHVNMGDHKVVERDQFPPVVIKAALAMQLGQVSDVLELDHTFTMFRLNAHMAPGTTKFGEVKDRLMKDLQKEKEDSLRIALGKRLRKTSKVEML
jgi:PPIC-type PPIASE domain/SurA N-terminal domain